MMIWSKDIQCWAVDPMVNVKEGYIGYIPYNERIYKIIFYQ